MKIAVLGAGAWGTAISINLCARHEVRLWARGPAQVERLRADRVNRRYLPDFSLPPAIILAGEMGRALDGAELILAAVTTNGLRETLRSVRSTGLNIPLVWLCKGFESEQARLPHQVCAEEMPNSVPRAALSGPSFAEEVARGLPAALALASTDAGFARDAARALHGATLRIYPSEDVIGVEVAGAVKNVIAIAAGICDGLELGFSARAALITRGLAEMTRLGVALGGRSETFMGLAGAGDLILTCTGDLSRNRRVGLALAKGMPLAEVLAALGHTAEGVYTARAVTRLATEARVEMPITRAVCGVLENPKQARAAVQELLAREQRAEY
ncbi:MAG: glycerol-3-phosphate dehydrogenase [Betaproteobacteria bacterium RIFCSPLOWO2_02_FULL_67_26]|nr:MAG: glycerol-3-phosphate dehydrogenase [Betaproteobacteria bacterium RIFCSPLOWO2_02_FULL_67_26]